MKNKLLVIYLILLSLKVMAQEQTQNIPSPKKTDLEKAALKGKVKILILESYKAESIDGKVVPGVRSAYSSENYSKQYNEKGYLIEKIEYSSGGTLIKYKHIFKYDKKENNVEQNTYYSNDTLYYKIIIRYDKYGNILTENTFDDEGNLESQIKFKYNKRKKISRIEYDQDKKMECKNTYKYNEKGLISEDNRFLSDNKLFRKFRYKYDEKGNQIEEKVYDPDDSLIYCNSWKYNDKGFKIEFTYTDIKKNKLSNKHIYNYDEQGNPIEHTEYDSEGNLVNKDKWEYEYDKENNWTKKIEFLRGNPRFISIRKIEYY